MFVAGSAAHIVHYLMAERYAGQGRYRPFERDDFSDFCRWYMYFTFPGFPGFQDFLAVDVQLLIFSLKSCHSDWVGDGVFKVCVCVIPEVFACKFLFSLSLPLPPAPLATAIEERLLDIKDFISHT